MSPRNNCADDDHKVAIESCLLGLERVTNWLILQPLQVALLLLVSLDRLASIVVPLRYYKWTNWHSYKMAGAAFALVIFQAAAGTVFIRVALCRFLS